MKHKAEGCVCQTCGKAFAYQKNLEDHQLTHANEGSTSGSVTVRPMESDTLVENTVSEKPNCSSDHNEMHLSNMEGKPTTERTIKGPMKVFACDECSKSYKRKDHLRRHKLSHTGDRPHVCLVCMKAFVRKDKLTRHEETHYNKSTTKFQCKVCAKGFRRKDSLNKHNLRHNMKSVTKKTLTEEALCLNMTVDEVDKNTVPAAETVQTVNSADDQTNMKEQEELLKQEM